MKSAWLCDFDEVGFIRGGNPKAAALVMSAPPLRFPPTMLQLSGGLGILRGFFFFSFTALSQFTFIQAVLHPANARQLLSDIAMVTECFYSKRCFS